MNGQERKTLDTILVHLKKQDKERNVVAKDVCTIKTVLMGDEKDREDLGLIGEVRDNTKFRKSAGKGLWGMFSALIATTAYLVRDAIKGG